MVNDNAPASYKCVHIFFFGGATAQGGPWPPLQCASRPLDPLLCLSIRLFPSFSGPWKCVYKSLNKLHLLSLSLWAGMTGVQIPAEEFLFLQNDPTGSGPQPATYSVATWIHSRV